MSTKYQLITELYGLISSAVVSSPKDWTTFLASACKNYKCRFDEQLLIYAQRPRATAVAGIETWNRHFKMWVNRNSKGIAVFDNRNGKNTLKYYFDIADTHEDKMGGKPVRIWQMEDRYNQAVSERLSDSFGSITATSIPLALLQTAENIVQDHIHDYLTELNSNKNDSQLDSLDDIQTETIYKKLLTNSIAFMLISRCGYEPSEYFTEDNFNEITFFNTPDTLNTLGIATSDISEMVLREISSVIRNVQITEKSQNRTFAFINTDYYDNLRKQPERSDNNERNHIQQAGRLSVAESEASTAGGSEPWQVRNDAQGLSGEEQKSDIYQPADQGRADELSIQDGAAGTEQTGAADRTALTATGSNRGAEGESTYAVDRSDEQHSQSGGGDNSKGADTELTEDENSNLPTIEEQHNAIAQAEEEKSSAFSLSKEDIDSVLQKGSGFAKGKYRIFRQFWNSNDKKENIEFLKKEYGTGGGTHIFPDGFGGTSWHNGKGIRIVRNGEYNKPDLLLNWTQVAKRIKELIDDNRYLNEKEREHYPEYLESIDAPQYEVDMHKRLLRKKFIESKRELSPADKKDTLALRLSDFIRDLELYEKDFLDDVERSDLKDIAAEEMENHLREPKTVQQLLDFLSLVQRKTVDVFSRSNSYRFRQELLELHPTKYQYKVGDIVFIGADKYEVASLKEDKVYIRNVNFPILGNEYSSADFEEKLKESAENEHLKVVVSEENIPVYPNTTPIDEEEYYFHYPDREKFEAVYYNPNAVSGGQFVFKTIPYSLITEAKESTDFTEDCFSYIEERAYTELVDLGTEDFESVLKEYENPSPLCIGNSEDTVKLLTSFTEREPVTKSENKIVRLIPVSNNDRVHENENKQVTERIVSFPAVKEGKPITPVQPRHNFRITDDNIGVGNPKERFRNNVNAINLLHRLQIENRLATPQEQEVLSKYVGWGGLSMAFDENNPEWTFECNELKEILSDTEYNSAMESTLTAFYTPPVVIKAMYDVLDNLGFSKGNILEPSCGTGNFLGLLPEKMKESKLHGIELDNISGEIAKQLYQSANISVDGFENTKLPDNHFDVVIGNVPFGNLTINDEAYGYKGYFIHDYFFAKALDKVRAGGVIMFITSKGTMDKSSPEIRRYIAQRAELLGAIRLPDNTFKSAAGTEVTSDILFLQKRERVIDVEPDWIYLDKTEDNLNINSYFIQNPDMVLGEIKAESTRFGGYEPSCKAYKDIPLSELLSKATAKITGTIPEYEHEVDEISDSQDTIIPADPNVRNFSYTISDGKVYFRENDIMTPAVLSATAESRIKGLIEIRDCVRRLIDYQTKDYPEDMIQTEQENLNRLYDRFTSIYGLINNRGNYLAFASDESYFLLCSLEILDDEGNFKKKADIFSKRTIKPYRAITSVDTSSEALALSIGEKACVDLEYMCELTGKSKDEIIKDLQGVIFKLPGGDSYVTADEYLSGNVRRKLKAAKAAAESNPEYSINVEALERVQPQDLSAGEISVRLGTTWIPESDIQDFMCDLLSPSYYATQKLKVRFSKASGDWFIESKSSDHGNIKAERTYGTERASAYRLIEDSLNLRATRIFDYIIDENGNRKAIFNKDETTAAQEKQELIKQAFQDWIWKDPDRRNRLTRYYNDTFNSVRTREYDGSHIVFGGINPEITLRPHQVNAIAHILYGGNTLLAHKVGAGKTFEMIAAAQESKRLGLCNKSMFVVPNHLVGQWASEYLRLYPTANILVTTKKDFETSNRKKFCGRIATGDYDAVIMGHSQFEKIPMSVERQQAQLESQLFDIEQGIKDAQRSRGEQFTIKQLMKSRRAIKERLKKLNDTSRKDNVIDFDSLGIDRLFVDESHFYKNLYLYTKMRNVGGIAQCEAQKSSDLFMKCRYMDEITGGKGVIFATGTPISNSMVEMYSVQRYLQYDTLLQNGLQHFDSWASTFGETVTAPELAPEGTKYRAKTRFAKFYNLPELMQMFREVADIQTADMLKLPVPKVNYHNIKVAPSQIQRDIVSSLAERAEKVRSGAVDAKVDNMLKITNDGRKLALDQRLFDPMLPDNESSKVNSCVANVYELWEKHADTKAAQLVFCDLSTPTDDGSFNVYDDMKNKLIDKGIPKEEIRFIHEANSDAKKKELFAKVRSGEVRVLIGSTPKMGAGTNVQDRLIAIHNLDCPWRPSDLEQRQGRIERQGNMFSEIEVYRYVTEDTFDAYLYQLVESKQKFIGQIMTSKSPVRSAEDIDEVALSFAEVKMLATGDIRFKEKMDLDMQVSRLRVLKQSYLRERYDLEDRILKKYPRTIKECEEIITGYKTDNEMAMQHSPNSDEGLCPMTLQGVDYTKKADAGSMLINLCLENISTKPIEIGSYRGFKIETVYNPLSAECKINLCGRLKYQVSLGDDPVGNITRIENEIAKIPKYIERKINEKEETTEQLRLAEAEIQKPFAYEDELKEKSEKLNRLNIELNLHEKDKGIIDSEPEQEESPERKTEDRER